MVLQRDAAVKVWGWAAANESISLEFIDSTYQATADSNGNWGVILKGLKAGGPYTMQIKARNVITLSDIMIGDVWVCSGQSNMALPMKRVSSIYQNEIESSENTVIRQYEVPEQYNFNEPQNDLTSGSWKVANPESILDFSAVAYFFANELYNTYKVPIGLIHASSGGSPIEAWLSEETLKKFPMHYKEAQYFKDGALINQTEYQNRVRIQRWYSFLRQNDEGYRDPNEQWYDPTLNTSDWATMKIPDYWVNTSLGPVSGAVWYRKNIRIPSSLAELKATLTLGEIVDADSVFINGIIVGPAATYQYLFKKYEIPSGLLKKGENTIVVRVISNSDNGGFVPGKPYELVVGGKTIDLTGDWQYRIGVTMEPLIGHTVIRWKPLGLFNAMINPLLNYKIKGAIWYQGEANAERPKEYKELFPALIEDWRANWKQGDFPFLFVQLANFRELKNQPGESNWALLRESQLKTLSLPNTGMAVTIDIGEGDDIHPLNKKDVGKRLAISAHKVAYGVETSVYSGPIYQSMKIDGKKVTITFTDIGSGLTAKRGRKLKYFSISGADKQFVWARAKIDNNKVIVWSNKVPNPIAVRYAWTDNPEGANLYNKEGVPASPFRTDDWLSD